MRKQITMALSAIALTSGLQALTIDEQVAANTINIGLTSASIESLTNTMTALEERINTLEAKVITLESFHDIRQITINESDTTQSLKDKLASLNYQSGEFVYLTTDSGQKSEFCTSNPKAVGWINTLPLEAYDYTWWGYNQTDTWMTQPTEPTWTPVYRINAIATPRYGGQFYISLLNNLSRGSEFNVRTTETGTTIYGYGNWSRSKNITLKIATTREGACGF